MTSNKLEERLNDYLNTFERALMQKIERKREYERARHESYLERQFEKERPRTGCYSEDCDYY